MFKEKLKELREENGLSQEKLAKLLFLKRYNVADWEQGRSEPCISDIIRICDALHCTPDELLDYEPKIEKRVTVHNSFNNSKNINVKL